MNRYRIGVLLYFRSDDGRILLIRRSRAPNRGLWCAIGGKLEMASGESPAECARREALEEVGVDVSDGDLSLRCLLSEQNYEGTGHWLMFVYEVGKRLSALPGDIDEGEFAFYAPDELAGLDMPRLDKSVLMDRILDPEAPAFHALFVPESAEVDLNGVVVEELIGGGESPR